MQTQQIYGVSGGGMLFSAKSTSVKSTDSNFEQLIQMSQNAGTSNEPTAKPVETKKEAAVDVAKTKQPEQAEQPTEVSSQKTDTTATAEEGPELKKAEGAEEPTDVEAAERALAILNQVADVVKDVLGLSEEELNQFLEELGITNLELLQPETLQNLVLMANSEQDAVVLLTDAELLSKVNELTAQVEQVLQEAGVTTEELISTLETPEFEAVVEQWNEVKTEENDENSTKVEKDVMVETAENAEVNTKAEILTEDKTSGSETETKTEVDSKEQDSDASTSVDQFAEQFVKNLQQAAEEISEVTGQKDIVQMIREIADQILEKVKVSVTAETTSLEIVLTPEELGKVNLTVSAEQDGMMKAKFVTENELAKEAIERNLVQFKEMLQEQGLKVDTIEVTVGNFEFDKNGQANESSQEDKKNGNRSFRSEEELGQIEETDQLAKIFMEGGESTVNYMA